MKALIAALLIMIATPVVADEHHRPGEVKTSAAFCKMTDDNLIEMRRIHKEWDVQAYEVLMRDQESTCFDTTINGFPLPPAAFVSYIMDPIKTKNGKCVQYVHLTIPAFNNEDVFSWVPSTKCGRDA